MKQPNMIRIGLVCIATCFCTVCGAGVPITWNGNGATSAWSDGANWEGGNAPGNGDTAVIPNGSVAYMSSADITWAASQGLALISLPGADSTLYITNNTAVTLSVPVSGIGKFNVANNCTDLTIGVNNPNFTGPFYFTNSTIKTDYSHNQCFGTYNVITNIVGDSKIYIFKGGDYHNEWRIFGPAATASGKSALYTYDKTIRLCGPVYVDGFFAIAAQQSKPLTICGGLHHSGLLSVYLYYAITVTGETPCDFQTTTKDNPGLNIEGGPVEFDAPVTEGSRIGLRNNAILKFARKNRLLPTTAIQNGRGGNVNGMNIDLNGFDQQCGTIYKYNNAGTSEDNSYVTSETPAKLTIYGQVQVYGYPDGSSSRYIAMSLRGAASLELNGTNEIKNAQGDAVWPKMEIRNCPTKSDTTGGLCVRRGTMTIADTTYWPNLSRLEAHDEGLLVMNTDGVNTNGFVFVVSNVVNSAVTIAAGKHLYAKSAYIGKWLEPGEYGGADAGLDAEHTLPQLGGLGTVHVLEWGGPKGLRLIFK